MIYTHCKTGCSNCLTDFGVGRRDSPLHPDSPHLFTHCLSLSLTTSPGMLQSFVCTTQTKYILSLPSPLLSSSECVLSLYYLLALRDFGVVGDSVVYPYLSNVPPCPFWNRSPPPTNANKTKDCLNTLELFHWYHLILRHRFASDLVL